MSRKVLKAKSNQRKIASYSFKTFSNVERGVKNFNFKELHTLTEETSDITGNITDEKSKTKNSTDLITKEDIKIAEKKGYDKGFQEGYKKGKDEAEKLLKNRYEAEKNDYLDLLRKNFQTVLNEIESLKNHFQELDDSLPDIIVKFVSEVISTERKINDTLIKSIVKNVLSKIKSYSDVTFIVSPNDKKFIEDMNLGYDIVTDSNLHKGDLKVKTNLGVIDFSINNLIEELKEKLYEEFESSKED